MKRQADGSEKMEADHGMTLRSWLFDEGGESLPLFSKYDKQRKEEDHAFVLHNDREIDDEDWGYYCGFCDEEASCLIQLPTGYLYLCKECLEHLSTVFNYTGDMNKKQTVSDIDFSQLKPWVEGNKEEFRKPEITVKEWMDLNDSK